ncbi:hypothetical protein [Dendronalium phyllosphericum]|uniref:hypothetical protein n=1 Tax=Dendronalium phyllosphericum TaxID=2840445 RepID=UPI001CEC06B9|nr:hypothetical protein [Dendronalium phyllosphericum]
MDYTIPYGLFQLVYGLLGDRIIPELAAVYPFKYFHGIELLYFVLSITKQLYIEISLLNDN